MKTTNPSYGLWDFLSGRAAGEVGIVREPPRFQLPMPTLIAVRQNGTGRSRRRRSRGLALLPLLNPIRTDDLLVGAALVGAGYLICRLTNR